MVASYIARTKRRGVSWVDEVARSIPRLAKISAADASMRAHCSAVRRRGRAQSDGAVTATALASLPSPVPAAPIAVMSESETRSMRYSSVVYCYPVRLVGHERVPSSSVLPAVCHVLCELTGKVFESTGLHAG